MLAHARDSCLIGHIGQNWLRAAQGPMKTLTAKNLSNSFGQLIDPPFGAVAVANHGRRVVVVMTIEEFERQSAIGTQPSTAIAARNRNSKD
jgi:hypothetical protein